VAGLWYAKNDLDRFFDRGPVLQLARYLAESTNENYSAFANATFDLTDKLSLTGGARINRQKIDYQLRQDDLRQHHARRGHHGSCSARPTRTTR
jgi:iron complex outermembrane receptor protein